MTNQNTVEEESDSHDSANVDTANRNESSDEVININFRRKDSEDSDTMQHCGGGALPMCGVNGMFCNSGGLLDSIFPYLSKDGISHDDNSTPRSPRDVRTIVGITPSSKPIRRGRFLIWPVLPECDTDPSTCANKCNTPISVASTE